MTQCSRFRAGVAHLVLAALVLSPASGWGGGPAVVPTRLRDVNGELVEVTALAARHRLVFITVKATWCPVCRTQLQRLARFLPELRACNVHFVVLVPGTPAAVAAVARETHFPFPFVADGRGGVAAGAGFAATPDELVPGFFVVNAARRVVWQQRGRAAGAFGDAALLDYLGCDVPERGPDILAAAPRDVIVHRRHGERSNIASHGHREGLTRGAGDSRMLAAAP